MKTNLLVGKTPFKVLSQIVLGFARQKLNVRIWNSNTN